MIDRYTLPEMGAIWTEEAKLQAWLDVELAAVRAWNRLGKVPDDALAEIEAKAAFERRPGGRDRTDHEPRRDRLSDQRRRARRRRLEVRPLRHDELRHARHRSGAADQARRRAAAARPRRARRGAQAARLRVSRHGAGRPHPRHPRRAHHLRHEARHVGLRGGPPSRAPAARDRRRRRGQAERRRRRLQQHRSAGRRARLRRARSRLSSPSPTRWCSATATPPSCRPWPSSAASLEKFAVEVRHLQRTEVREAEEAFGKGQKGSSAMPHKRNPILSERMAGCARVLRGNAARGHGERGALARARHLAQLRGAHRVSRLLHPARLHAAEVDEAPRHPGRRRGPHAGQPRAVAAPRVQRRRAARAGRPAACCATTPTGSCRTRPCGPGARASTSASSIKADPEATAVLSPAEIDAAMDPDQYRAGREVIFGRLEGLAF